MHYTKEPSPDFYRLLDQNYKHSYSGSHINMIAYSSLQNYMSEFFLIRLPPKHIKQSVSCYLHNKMLSFVIHAGYEYGVIAEKYILNPLTRVMYFVLIPRIKIFKIREVPPFFLVEIFGCVPNPNFQRRCYVPALYFYNLVFISENVASSVVCTLKRFFFSCG